MSDKLKPHAMSEIDVLREGLKFTCRLRLLIVSHSNLCSNSFYIYI